MPQTMSSHSRVFSIICFSTRKYPHPPYGEQWKIWGEGMVQREEISEEKGWLFEVLFSDCQVIKKLTALLLSKLSVNGHFKIRIAVLIEKILNKLGWMLFSWNRHANKSPVISRLLYYTTVIMFTYHLHHMVRNTQQDSIQENLTVTFQITHPAQERQATPPGFRSCTLLEHGGVGSFTSHKDRISESAVRRESAKINLVCRFPFKTFGFSSLSEIRKSNHLQVSLQRHHFLLNYFKTLSVGPAGFWTCETPLAGALPSDITRRRYTGCNVVVFWAFFYSNCLWLVDRAEKNIYLLLSPAFSFTLYVLEQLQILMNARKISTTVNKVLAKSKSKKCPNYLGLTLLTWIWVEIFGKIQRTYLTKN